ncbi:MAG: hypothetical protein RIT04_524 [Candidatus Parcubacteria bacterium]|jgi:uncharacterized membrane protein YkgB
MSIRNTFEKIDDRIIHVLRRASMPAARLSLFIVFFWFGILKIIGTSPANPLVSGLLEQTLPFITFNTFIILFALYEMVIGIAFLIPRCERFAIALLVGHMITTILPLFLLTAVTWQGFLTPTLEGQYIIKNLVIIALAIGVAAHLTPMSHERGRR